MQRLPLFLSLLFSLFAGALPAAAQSQPPGFEACFENDAEGTWLVYPTVPGCHYKVESSPSLNDADFTLEQGSFHYGTGAVRRIWLAPPPPPPGPVVLPPPRPYTYLYLEFRISTDSASPDVEIHCNHPDHPWAVRVSEALPVRQTPFRIPLNIIKSTPAEFTTISGCARFMPSSEFSFGAGPPDFAAGSPEAAEWAILQANWPRIVDALTPPEPDLALVPVVPPQPNPAPPDFSARRFFRVRQSVIDTNINTIPDWYELQFGYDPFATSFAQAGYLTAMGDGDSDGLSSWEEFLHGTDLHKRDTDGDYETDGSEVHYEPEPSTNPRDPASVHSAFLIMRSYLNAETYFGAYLGWEHSLTCWVEDRLATVEPYRPFSYPLKYASGYDAYSPFSPGLPDYSNLHYTLANAAGFIPDEDGYEDRLPPQWWLARPPLATDPLLFQRPRIHSVEANSFLDAESSTYMKLDRIYVRTRAPEDADLLVPVQINTYAHWTMAGPYATYPAPVEPESTAIKYLRVPAGTGVSDDGIDLMPTVEVPYDFDPVSYVPTGSDLGIPASSIDAKIIDQTTIIDGEVITRIEFNIIADTNRDGEIEPESDTKGKGSFTTGPDGKGAIILVNCDDDDGDHFPDNWPGGIPGWHNGRVRQGNPISQTSFGPNRSLTAAVTRPVWVKANLTDSQPYNGDYYINGATDLKDCARFRVKRMKSLSTKAKVKLFVTRPMKADGKAETEPAYFARPEAQYPGGNSILPEHRLRIFLPKTEQSGTSGNNIVPAADDVELIGPGSGAEAVFSPTPSATQQNISLLKEKDGQPGWVEFAVEGLEFAAMTDVWLSIDPQGNGKWQKPDKIRLKCAPFIAVSHQMPVKETLLADSAIPETVAFNQDFDQHDNVPTRKLAFANRFPQDQFEIGYTEMPAFPGETSRMTVLLGLPFDTNNVGMDNIMTDGVGLFYRLNYIGWKLGPEAAPGSIAPDSINYGGNIECTPPIEVAGKKYGMGRIVVGTALTPGLGYNFSVFPNTTQSRVNLNNDLLNFLKAQEVQSPVEVPMEWSDLRHIDEVVSFIPNLSTTNSDDFIALMPSVTKAESILQTLPGQPPFRIFTAMPNSNPYQGAGVCDLPYYNGNPWAPFYANLTGVYAGATGVKNANAKVEQNLQAVKALLKTSLGLSDSDFRVVPQLYGIGERGMASCGQSPLANVQVIGARALAHQWYGPSVMVNGSPRDAFGLELDKVLQSLGYSVSFLQSAKYYADQQSGVHCASTVMPNLQTQTTNWWK